MELAVEHLTKSFSGTPVLNDVSFTLKSGEVVALLGQNGSGKSTLIKLLTGFHVPDPGSNAALVLDGTRYPLPVVDQQLPDFRIGAVHQDLGLVVSASVGENLLLGQPGTTGLRPIRWSKFYAKADQMLARVGAKNVPARAVVRDLPAVQRAAVAMARAVGHVAGRGLLILDEVTAFLTQDGVDELFELVQEASKAGVMVLFVSHRLEEIWRICSRAIVLRNGNLVADTNLQGKTNDDLVDAIVGQPLDWLYPPKSEVSGPVRLRLGVEDEPRSAGFQIQARAGEILGVTGLRGMGYQRVIRTLYGELPRRGHLQIDDDEIDLLDMNPIRAYRLGIRLVPSDRLKNAAFGDASVSENASLPVLAQFMRHGLYRRRSEAAWVEELVHDYGIVPQDPVVPFRALSGGNQQKVVVAHWLETQPRVLLLDEPVQGVDVGARRDIFLRIVQSANSGVTIVYSSSEPDDLAELCHRVLVFRDGRISGELSGAAVTAHSISRMSWTAPGDAEKFEAEHHG
ncbi:MAG: sugar ABC transporter ATP-binding protein [Actinomycetota bacterium]|jgi:ribose transport system ATP-binding protein|nr:sugar ABC transporter ATP-binding protein [Actinomycetota bacterium]